jgi:hypothetical protein
VLYFFYRSSLAYRDHSAQGFVKLFYEWRVIKMSANDFIGYLGDADFHDGAIVGVQRRDDTAIVELVGASGSLFSVEFVGVEQVNSFQPENMLLYALCEMKHEGPKRRFEFLNWEEQDKAFLEIIAENLNVHKVGITKKARG